MLKQALEGAALGAHLAACQHQIALQDEALAAHVRRIQELEAQLGRKIAELALI
jgi:hypothetical protein